MKQITSLILLFTTISMFAQKEASNWYFGVFAGIHFDETGNVTALQNSAIQTNEGCSSISDSSGNLLFYTDGRNVWDKNHVLMPNGNYAAGTGLLGDPSSTQSAMIVPNKANPNIYYIFTVDEPHHQNAGSYPNQFSGTYEDGGSVPGEDDGFNNGFNYSVVDLSVVGSNGSIGDVVTRNVHLVTYNPANTEEIKYKCSEKVTAVKNSTGTGFWVITQFTNKFHAFEVTAAGVNETPVVTQLNPLVPVSGYRRNSIGCIKASPNGRKIAIAHTQLSTITGGTESNGQAWLYDFDNATGQLSNPLMLKQDCIPYGIEFSQRTKKLYISYDNAGNGFGGVHQYDLESSDIPASEVFLASTNQSGTLQLGPNGKIYRAVVNTGILDVINSPEENGTLCGYVSGQISLGSGTSFFGLPPFITSYFSVDITANNKCFGSITEFELTTDDNFDTVAWDFGDSQTAPASPQATTTHTYGAPGTYTVVATATYQGEIHTESTDITITSTPVANAAPNLKECDPNNDGITVFNLSLNTATILGNQNVTENTVKYFDSQNNANQNVLPVNATAYTNHNNPQRIYARIHNNINPECYELVSFLVSAIDSPATDSLVQEILCLNNPEGLILTAMVNNAELYQYEWSTGEITSKVTVYQPGAYSVTITNQAECSSIKTFIVTASDVAVVDDIIVNDMRDNNTITVLVSPPSGVETTYTYSLDSPNGPFEESNFFEGVSPGIHTIYIKDTKGCGITSQEVTVLATPKFFTPNGDGINDTWNIIGVNTYFYPNSKIYIFDRYGKLLADVDPKGIGWNGIFEGRQLPATDYWFVVQLDNGRIIKGHFSLMR